MQEILRIVFAAALVALGLTWIIQRRASLAIRGGPTITSIRGPAAIAAGVFSLALGVLLLMYWL
jgi:hypothetical protein